MVRRISKGRSEKVVGLRLLSGGVCRTGMPVLPLAFLGRGGSGISFMFVVEISEVLLAG